MHQWISSSQTDYQYMVDRMQNKVENVISGNDEECIFLTEHKSVYTIGVTGKEDLIDKNVKIIQSNRGGGITFHALGQRLVYPILNLRRRDMCDVRLYVNNLENWCINTLSRFNIQSYIINDMPGVWTRSDNDIPIKLAFIGVRIRKWVTYHGMAINIFNDLEPYKKIHPCGIKDMRVSSLRKVGVNISMEEFDEVLKEEFYKIF